MSEFNTSHAFSASSSILVREPSRRWGVETCGVDGVGSPRSAADPDTLARAVQAHKAGDVFAQAMLTLALVVAIGAVAVVLSVERASAAGFLMQDVITHSASLTAVSIVGGVLLLATRTTLRLARARSRRR